MNAPEAQSNGHGHVHINGSHINGSHTDGTYTNGTRINDTYTNGTHINGVTNGLDKGPIPIAVCGMAMRLPGNVSTAEQFWDFLVTKKDARSPVPPERYNADAFHAEGFQGYFLKDVDLRRFDASPFRVSRLEVQQMDPQHRLLLELTKYVSLL